VRIVTGGWVPRNGLRNPQVQETVFGNTTHGSGWIVQLRPTHVAHPEFPFCFPSLPSRREGREIGKPTGPASHLLYCRLHLNDPPTAVGGIPRSFHTLSAVGGLFRCGLQKEPPAPLVWFPSSPRGARGGRTGKTGIPGAPLCRLYLNNPPTAVGGISGFLTLGLARWA
jgi:hypothetical protein